MGLESATYLTDLVNTNPVSSDAKSQGDDHIRLIKAVLLSSFPGIAGAMTASHTELNILDGATLSTAELNILDGVTASTAELNILDGATLTTTELNYVDGVTSAIQTQLDLKAPLDSPALTGTPTAPTASTGTSTTQLATTAFVAATAFSSSLPALTGNQEKFLKVNSAGDAQWSTIMDTSVMTPFAGTAFATTTATQTLTNKTLQTPIFQDSSDTTKKANLVLSGITAGQNRAITLADEAMTLFTPGIRLLSTVTASSSATVDLETTFNSTYDVYIIEANGVTVQTNAVEFQFLMKIGGSYVTANYNGNGRNIGNITAGTYGMLIDNVSNGASASINFTMRVPNPASTTFAKVAYFAGIVGTSTIADMEVGGVMMNTGTSALTGIRFQASSGNIVAGTFRLYGVRKT